MQMQSLIKILLVSYFLHSANSFAYVPKEGNVSAILGPIISKTNFNGTDSQMRSPNSLGVGLFTQGDISDHGSLEIGLIHMNKVFFREQDGDFLAEQTEKMHISMGYRRWLSPSFSYSWAFYSSYSMGKPLVLEQKIATGHQLDTSARDITEYGFDFSIQSEIWERDPYSVIFNGFYSLSLTRKKNEYADHYGFILGLKYFIQEKQVIEKPKTSP